MVVGLNLDFGVFGLMATRYFVTDSSAYNFLVKEHLFSVLLPDIFSNLVGGIVFGSWQKDVIDSELKLFTESYQIHPSTVYYASKPY